MPVAVHISPHQMSKADYESVIGELQAAGAAEPEGRLFHAAYGDEHVRMFEVWESPEQFEQYHEGVFCKVQAATVGPAAIEIHQLHSPHPD